MSNIRDTISASNIYKETLAGLRSFPKHLNAKYFYDKRGDELFQQIMVMPEYYPFDCELEIFQQHSPRIAKLCGAEDQPLDIIELGAGDGQKTRYLLRAIHETSPASRYHPVDFSENILAQLKSRIAEYLPAMEVRPLSGDNLDALPQISRAAGFRKLVLSLGGNIGNMESSEIKHFCTALRQSLRAGDLALIGFDLRKDPETILRAYNDPSGLTAAFNKNLLLRLNRELQTNFDIERFKHYQTYDPVTGACKSYLISLVNQTISLLEEQIVFKEFEPIYMEISQKFTVEQLDELSGACGFKMVAEFSDHRHWFLDVLWEVQ